MSGPLEGIRIVEMVGLGPAPFCGMLLADLGADVLRIDRPNSFNFAGVAGSRFDVLARGRSAIAVDLRKPGAAEAMLALIAGADALIEGFRPAVMERMGLGPDACLAANPRLVYGRMTGWGQSGPLAQASGHDVNYIALSGVLNAVGPAGAPPVIPANFIGDFGGGGMLLALGVLAALLEARASGRGQVVDAAMTDGSALLSASLWGLRQAGLWKSERGTNVIDGGAPFYNVYACADGKYVTIGAIEPQFYALLRQKLNLDDSQFDAQMAQEHWPDRRSRMAEIFVTKTRQEWCDLLEGSDVCFAPVLDWDEAPAHPHNRARGTFVEIDGVTQPAPAPRFSRTPADTPRATRAPHRDGTDVLREWGADAALVERFRDLGSA
jgi:alpha-methylacyl-CoA racemase